MFFSTLVFACVPGAHDWVKLFRGGWALGGLLFSEGLAALVETWFGPPQLVVSLIRPLGLAAIWIGESARAIVPAEELRPRVATTLFDHDEGEE
ncbi:MAG: hypothetical protein HY858_05645 [Candidatus Solibacter usitatus]|nr:hypothetical protein [Candidatus Solibacter usitatus]